MTHQTHCSVTFYGSKMNSRGKRERNTPRGQLIKMGKSQFPEKWGLKQSDQKWCTPDMGATEKYLTISKIIIGKRVYALI